MLGENIRSNKEEPEEPTVTVQQGKKPKKDDKANSPSDLNSALTQAQSIVEAAEQRAKKLEEDAKKSYEEAKERGYAEGISLARDEVLGEAVRLIEDTAQLQESLAQEAAQLALAIAGVVVDGEISTKPERVIQIALRALRESVVGENVVLLCNEKDIAQLESAMSEFRRLAGGAAISIESDDTIARGGCIVRTEFGEVDASIERLLRNIAERLELTRDGKQR